MQHSVSVILISLVTLSPLTVHAKELYEDVRMTCTPLRSAGFIRDIKNDTWHANSFIPTQRYLVETSSVPKFPYVVRNASTNQVLYTCLEGIDDKGNLDCGFDMWGGIATLEIRFNVKSGRYIQSNWRDSYYTEVKGGGPYVGRKPATASIEIGTCITEA